MSEPDHFLARWSRRKLEARDEPPAEQPEPPRDAAAEPPAVAGDESSQAVAADLEARDEARADAHTDETNPPVDLSALPPVESISAETDIRAFLQPGIPLQLTRAALRRAWSADPAIRDFIGLAENAYDFTAPDGVPGFGPLQPNDIARLTVAQVAEQVAPDSPPAVAEPLRNREVSAAREAPDPAAAEEASPVEEAGPVPGQHSEADDAVQQEQARDEPAIALAARHGGALPR